MDGSRHPERATGMSRIGTRIRAGASRSAADPRVRRGGIRVASWLLVSVAMAVTLPGCIITQPVHFDEPANSPPAIYEVTPMPMHPLDEVVGVFPMTLADAGSAVVPTQTFDAIVYDLDVDQSLQYQVLVDGIRCQTCVTNSGILPASTSLTDRVRRRLTFNVGGGLLDPGTTGNCHSVRLLVSGQFQPGGQDPVEDGDLASATWWIASRTVDEGAPPVDMGTCLR